MKWAEPEKENENEREREISNKRLMGKNIDWLSEAKNYTLLGRFVCVWDKEKKDWENIWQQRKKENGELNRERKR